MGKQLVFDEIDDEANRLRSLSEELWELAEPGLEEEASASLLCEVLEAEGFTVEHGVGGLPTAFVATYGEGEPVVGFLGEYDALQGLSQTVGTEREPRDPGGAGHGCGHNLLGTGCLGAAIGVKRAIQAGEASGSVVYFGCPAEEQLVGKVYMARAGAFDDIDVALTWHPSDATRLLRGSSLALDSITYTFEGTAAHAAISPESGRSALDAVQLMNLGVEHMREHAPEGASLHYNVTDGGDAPNVVPATASVWYFVRGPNRDVVERTSDWVSDVATGAATMTQTDVEKRHLTGCYDILANQTVSDVVWENVRQIGSIDYDVSDRRRAAQLQETIAAEDVESSIDAFPDEARKTASERALYDEPVATYGDGDLPGSSDVGDVSWITPTAWLYAATYPLGTAAHSWQAVASAGSFGQRAVPYVAKILGGAAYDLLTDESLVEAAHEEFDARTADRAYSSPLPADGEPPFELLDDR